MGKYKYKIIYQVQSQYEDEIEMIPYREEPNKTYRKYYKDLSNEVLNIESNKEISDNELIKKTIKIHVEKYRNGYTTDQLITSSIEVLKGSSIIEEPKLKIEKVEKSIPTLTSKYKIKKLGVIKPKFI
jgi:hypothetical protein